MIFDVEAEHKAGVKAFVSHFVIYPVTESIYAESVASIRIVFTAVIIFLHLTGCLSAYAIGNIRTGTQGSTVILSKVEAGGHHDGELDIQLVHVHFAYIFHFFTGTYRYEVQ